MPVHYSTNIVTVREARVSFTLQSAKNSAKLIRLMEA